MRIILFSSSGKNNQQLEGIFQFRFLHRITMALLFYFPPPLKNVFVSVFSPLALSHSSVFNLIFPYSSCFCCCVSARHSRSVCHAGVTYAPTFFLQVHCCLTASSQSTWKALDVWIAASARWVKLSSNTAVRRSALREELRAREQWTYLSKHCKRDETFWSCWVETFDCITGSRWGQIFDFSANLWVFTVTEDECLSVSGDEKS